MRDNKEDDIRSVNEFWEANLCGSHFVKSGLYTERFFKEYSEYRYRKTHHLDTYIDWEGARDKKILELGLGVGADAVRWAQHGADYYGIDLTKESVGSVQQYFRILGLSGNISQGNAEKLSFNDNEFDLVYSHGVLHHTPDFRKALQEVNRVLKPGGEFILMLYAKESFNYWIRIQVYFRLRLLLHLIASKLGSHTRSPLWSEHLANLKESGIGYLGWRTFPHHCTDGPGCTIANIFSKKRVVTDLETSGFRVQSTRKAHFPVSGKFPRLERFIAKFIGFHRFFWAYKT